MNHIKLDQDGSEFHCRLHPTGWFHEIGCDHIDWSRNQLRDALITSKKGAYEATMKLEEEINRLQGIIIRQRND